MTVKLKKDFEVNKLLTIDLYTNIYNHIVTYSHIISEIEYGKQQPIINKSK